MQTDAIAAIGPDRLAALVDALDAAVESARGGGWRAGIGGLAPAAGRVLATAVYGASYAVSFGIALPAVTFARAIPMGNAAVHGLIDGARAAMEAVQDRTAGADRDAGSEGSLA